MDEHIIELKYKQNILKISCLCRFSGLDTIVFLHGLGCAKNDYHAAFDSDELKEFSIVTFDFPGNGYTGYIDNIKFTIDDLVMLTGQITESLNLQKFHLCGHSMGGLVAQLFAEMYPRKVVSLTNVEGNLAGSDCFFSRKISTMGRNAFCKGAFPRYVHRLKISPNKGLQIHGKIMQEFTNPDAMFDVCPSLVNYSDNGNLLQRFVSLPMPALFIYGSVNKELPYLPMLKKAHCPLTEISQSGHFPQYDNPQEFYRSIYKFISHID